MLVLLVMLSLGLTIHYYYKYNHLTKTLIDKDNELTKELSVKSKELIAIKKEIEKVDGNFTERKEEIANYLKEHADVNYVLNLSDEIKRLKEENTNIEKQQLELLKSREDLNEVIDLMEEKKKIEKDIKNLKENFDILTDLIYLQDFGLYDSDVDLRKYSKDSYVRKIKEKQKELLKGDNYFEVIQGYSVNGNAKKGYKLQKDNAKVGIRCLNEESKTIIKGSTPSNRVTRIKRLEKSIDIINKNLQSVGIQIIEDVLDIKKELLDIEIAKYVKKEEEKEKLKLLKEEERELRLIEKEKQMELEKIKKEENHIQKELERLEKENVNNKKYQEQIDDLMKKLTELENNKSEIEENIFKGKAGYVYIIGNKGAFGEGVYKIGVTRRLNPSERIRELGSASVPFKFETHALIFSEDAFSLENRLHKTFEKDRVNKINNHKEFFRTSLNEIREEVLKIDSSVEFDMNDIDYEYFQTLKIIEKDLA